MQAEANLYTALMGHGGGPYAANPFVVGDLRAYIGAIQECWEAETEFLCDGELVFVLLAYLNDTKGG